VTVTADPSTALVGAEVAVDFSAPERIAAHAQACVERGVPLLVGATGFDAPTRSLLEATSRRIAVLVAPNTSVGIAVLRRLVALAAAALGEGFDVEISEAHHRLKRDAPSGTALALAEAAAQARDRLLADVAVYERHGVGAARRPGSIGFSVTRAGDIVGEHTVMFAAAGERLELTHRATDRMVFARGALQAAKWLIARPPGLYGMGDVLGL
jgi:4-hydroxy-tetrahydrodipicolinate reductase